MNYGEYSPTCKFNKQQTWPNLPTGNKTFCATQERVKTIFFFFFFCAPSNIILYIFAKTYAHRKLPCVYIMLKKYTGIVQPVVLSSPNDGDFA